MEKYPFKDFVEGKVRVCVANRDEARLLMAECEKRGIRWLSGDNATDHYYSRCDIFTAQIRKSSPDRALMFNTNFMSHKNTITLDQLQLDDPKPEKRYQILIESDGDTTTAKMIVNGKEVKSAQAKRNPDDKPNWKIGAEMAFGRLFGKKTGVQPDIQVRRVRRQACEGEYIEIINAWGTLDAYKNGDILKVLCQSGRGVMVLLTIPNLGCKMPKYIASDEYVVLEGYKPKK